jgi:hypothetical protein
MILEPKFAVISSKPVTSPFVCNIQNDLFLAWSFTSIRGLKPGPQVNFDAAGKIFTWRQGRLISRKNFAIF